MTISIKSFKENEKENKNSRNGDLSTCQNLYRVLGIHISLNHYHNPQSTGELKQITQVTANNGQH